jgi:hypothetical protein
MSQDDVIDISSGGIWDFEDWTLRVNYRMDKYDRGPCPHTRDGIVPFVVVALNEGGYNSTGVCAQCIIEAVRKHGSALLPCGC